MHSLWNLDPATYQPHALHKPDRSFPESNCYVDVWIELLHAQGLDPMPMLAFCVGTDFEGDQWTFFKPPAADLEALYGLHAEEMTVYRPMPDHLVEQIALGRTVIVEVDAFYLPDVAGRSYRSNHEKTSVAVESIDPENRRLRYFHNAGYFELTREDYDDVMRVGRAFDPEVLEPYTEFVRAGGLQRLPDAELRARAAQLLTRHAQRMATENPVTRFGDRLALDMPGLAGNLPAYHLYAFATLRQCGAAWSLAAEFLRWLDAEYEPAAEAFDRLAAQSRALLLKLARVAHTSRAFDPSEAIASMAADWEAARALLAGAAGEQ